MFLRLPFTFNAWIFYTLMYSLHAGFGKIPGFSSKTQPSGFNWFKPGYKEFYGLNWGGEFRFPLYIRIEEPNLDNHKIILHKIDE